MTSAASPSFLCLGRRGDAICPRRMNCDRYLAALVMSDATRDGRPISSWLCTETRDLFAPVNPSNTANPSNP